jgi:hypothetical protein
MLVTPNGVRLNMILCSVVQPINIALLGVLKDRLCSLVARVLGYRSGGPGSIPGTAKKKK